MQWQRAVRPAAARRLAKCGGSGEGAVHAYPYARAHACRCARIDRYVPMGIRTSIHGAYAPAACARVCVHTVCLLGDGEQPCCCGPATPPLWQERSWLRLKSHGELDETRLVDAAVGERQIFKRRGKPPQRLGSQQLKPKHLAFLLDASASMARGNAHDGRLTRMAATAALLMEALGKLTAARGRATVGVRVQIRVGVGVGARVRALLMEALGKLPAVRSPRASLPVSPWTSPCSCLPPAICISIVHVCLSFNPFPLPPLPTPLLASPAASKLLPSPRLASPPLKLGSPRTAPPMCRR